MQRQCCRIEENSHAPKRKNRRQASAFRLLITSVDGRGAALLACQFSG